MMRYLFFPRRRSRDLKTIRQSIRHGLPQYEHLEDKLLLTRLVGDFNRDGYDDLAVGAPKGNVSAALDAGAVTIIDGSANGLSAANSRVLTEDSIWQFAGGQGQSEPRDDFGAALAVGDFDNDGFGDLAIGAPGEDDAAGAVTILYGASQGFDLAKTQLLTQQLLREADGASSPSEPGDAFGFSLAVGKFDGDDFDDLAVGAPNENDGAVIEAGAVTIIHGSGNGLSAANSRIITQRTLRDAGGAISPSEPGDHFGFSLAVMLGDLVVGAPDEDDGAVADAGAVTVIARSANGLSAANSRVITQTTLREARGAESPSEAGDRFGFSLAVGNFDGDPFDDLAVGAPSEDHGAVTDAGAVTIIAGSLTIVSPANSRVITQNTLREARGAESPSEPGDRFGFSLAVGNFNGDPFDDLAVGAPSEDDGAVTDAGAVTIINGSFVGLSPANSRLITQRTLRGLAVPSPLLSRAIASAFPWQSGISTTTSSTTSPSAHRARMMGRPPTPAL